MTRKKLVLNFLVRCINTKAESKIIATSCITADAVKSNVTLGITGIILPFVWTLQLSSSWSYIGMALASCHGVYPVSGASPVVVDVLSFPEWHCAQFFSTLNDDGTIGVGSQRVQIGADYKTVTVQDYTAAGASGGVNKGFRFQPLYKV
ncbi:hypothetical protein BCR33DRAFT_416495 [Rhizoclosmatium globosum]|uniref:Uncharacterized protein n=1 Tax=Rhizoclosmatium globosum TaxID=329046 RepID=A0A1Y2BW96_9FUNG|nr:hypothetical protein BCR33DRAFT_416495 [Rhizoclosmatium globosum]|eukprot:ORY39026.1 hypothetical protein BCR33DRAFT_416495 [Rhizoclosmatium globosum]